MKVQRYWGFLSGIIVNVSAGLWTIDCPTKGSVNTLVENFWVSNELTENDVYYEFDRYRNCSAKSITRAERGITSSLIHGLRIKSPLPPSYYMWPNSFLNHNPVGHLVVTGGDEVQTQVFQGQTHSHLHIVSKHEWGSWYYFGAKAHVHIHNGESRIALLTDDSATTTHTKSTLSNDNAIPYDMVEYEPKTWSNIIADTPSSCHVWLWYYIIYFRRSDYSHICDTPLIEFHGNPFIILLAILLTDRQIGTHRNITSFGGGT